MKSFSFTSLIGVIAATSVLLLSSEVQLQAQNGNGAVRPYVGNFVNNGTFLEVSNSTGTATNPKLIVPFHILATIHFNYAVVMPALKKLLLSFNG